MKNKLTFLLIASRIGVQRRFSINKKFFFLILLSLALLIGGGAVGVWKAGENQQLTQQKHLLETEQRQMQTISRMVTIIEQEEIAIRDLLGIKNTAQPSDAPTDEG